MTTASFLKLLNKKVQKYKTKYKLSEGKAFGLWLVMEYLSLDEGEAFEAVSIDGGNDKDIDLFFVDDESERVVIGQLKFNAKGRYKASKNELLGLIHTTDWLKDAEGMKRQGRPELEAAALDYNQAIASGYSVEYIYAFCGPDHRDVSDAARQFNLSEAGNLPSRFCKLMALDTLKTIHDETINQSTRIASCELLRITHYFEESGDYGEAIVTTLDGEQLRQLYETYGDRLFDRNVRLFLGARKGGVNAGIQETLGSKTERKNFWAYNNGLTFICDDYTSPSRGKLKLTNFSIVNGCQTTVSLASASAEALKDVRVLVRFIRASERVIDSVITFNNSQNPIRLWDLNSQDKLQKKLKRDLAALPQPYFYALRKGEMQKLTDAERTKFRRDKRSHEPLRLQRAAVLQILESDPSQLDPNASGPHLQLEIRYLIARVPRAERVLQHRRECKRLKKVHHLHALIRHSFGHFARAQGRADPGQELLTPPCNKLAMHSRF